MQALTGCCAICGAASSEVFSATLLRRHCVRYFQCPNCEFLCTEAPHWLDEAYSNAISSTDTGLVKRNLLIAKQLSALLDGFFDSNGRYLDIAGGTGLLTRLMRDTGFDFRWEDAYCSNQLAVGFDALPSESGFEAVTAFEAIEHMPDPMTFVRDALARSRSRTLIFTTELFKAPQPAQDWWYYAPATGQHISFFQPEQCRKLPGAAAYGFIPTGFCICSRRSKFRHGNTAGR